jgi:hypothetical protein
MLEPHTDGQRIVNQELRCGADNWNTGYNPRRMRPLFVYFCTDCRVTCCIYASGRQHTGDGFPGISIWLETCCIYASGRQHTGDGFPGISIWLETCCQLIVAYHSACDEWRHRVVNRSWFFDEFNRSRNVDRRHESTK